MITQAARTIAAALAAGVVVCIAFAWADAYGAAEAEIVRLDGELTRYERLVPQLKACQEAADTGHALAWAWWDWAHDKTAEHTRRVEQLQAEQGPQLYDCGLIPGEANR